MNMTIESRTTTNMRRIRKGDRFIEAGELWEVTGTPRFVDGSNEMSRFP
jgi:hypothetical protein